MFISGLESPSHKYSVLEGVYSGKCGAPSVRPSKRMALGGAGVASPTSSPGKIHQFTSSAVVRLNVRVFQMLGRCHAGAMSFFLFNTDTSDKLETTRLSHYKKNKL